MEVTNVVSQSPCLLHAVLTLTAMHDRFLASDGHQERTRWESFHWAMAVRLFKQQLFDLEKREALWMTATSLSWISLCNVETQDPNVVWPMKPASSSDLNWLEMQKGEKLPSRRTGRTKESGGIPLQRE